MKIEQNFDFFSIKDAKDENFSELLKFCAKECFFRLSFSFTEEHLKNLANAALSSTASENDRFICKSLLKNAIIAGQKKFPLCQDTGIAVVFGWADEDFCKNLNFSLYDSLYAGVFSVYKENALRFSTNSPKNFWQEFDPQNNMPPQISIFLGNATLAPKIDFDCRQATGESGIAFLFCAKGGGSSNKTIFLQGTKADLEPENFEKILRENIQKIGTSACPPYTLSVVAGGLSPEQNLLTLKLATMGAYEKMGTTPCDFGFRDKKIEELLIKIAQETKLGAQFGGIFFALNAFAIRLPRHGASFPISIGVSCAAHRNLRAFLTKRGVFIQKTIFSPENLAEVQNALKINQTQQKSTNAIKIDLNCGIQNILQKIGKINPGSALLLNGEILVARDKAHFRWFEQFKNQKTLPDYVKKYPIFYAGPAKTPEGCVIGSFGPTTAGRMDFYADFLMQNGASLITIAKGKRSEDFRKLCEHFGAIYLGVPGGIAALIAKENIVSQKILDFEDLGMEAVRLVTVKNLPAFILINAKGKDFYAKQ